MTHAGRGAPAASVELLHEPREALVTPTPRVHACDGEGRLTLELAPGTVRAVAWSADACALPASVALEPGSPAVIELDLEPAFPLAGRVVDARTGAPIAGARVALWTYAERDTVTTGPDGGFLHPRFPARAPSQQVAARAEGFGLAVRYLRIGDDGAWKLSAVRAGEASVRGSGTPWVELELVPELRVRGRVVDPSGEPVAGARVSAEGFFHAMPSVASRDHATTTSDAEGTFELAALRSDVSHSLLVEAAGFAQETCELVGETPVHDLGTLVLAPETVLAGVAIDLDGLPLADVKVVLHDAGPWPVVETRSALDVPARIQGRERRATTTPEGTFLFEHLASRPVTLTLEHASGLRAELELLPLVDGGFESPCVTLRPASLTALDGRP